MLTSQARMDRFWADELGCSPADLYGGGLSMHAPEHRAGPRWMGWMVPVDCVRVDGAAPGAGVLSVTPRLERALGDYLAHECTPESCLPPEGRALPRFIHDYLPSATPKVHHILHCDAVTFQPAPDPFPVGLLHERDLHADWYRLHFDGPVYVARNDWGHIIAWAAIKCKSDDVWEMAVVTDAPYRGRGLARSVVSHATRAALDAGKLPIYLHEVTNTPSARVCRALGYQFYGYELTCEYGRVTKR